MPPHSRLNDLQQQDLFREPPPVPNGLTLEPETRRRLTELLSNLLRNYRELQSQGPIREVEHE